MKFSHRRLFFALFPQQQVCWQLLRAFQSEEANLPKRIMPEQLHLTLLYLGKVTDTECNKLVRAIAGIQHGRFNLKISRAGWWQKAGVAWLAPGEWPGALDSLVADITGVSRYWSPAGVSAPISPSRDGYDTHFPVNFRRFCGKYRIFAW